MKKLLIFLPIVLLSACGWINKQDQQVNNIDQDKNQQLDIELEQQENDNSKNQWNIENQEKELVNDIETKQKDLNKWNLKQQNFIKEREKEVEKKEKELKKWDEIVNSKSGLFFYNLDCKKLFKTQETIKKCQMACLKEAGYSCIDTSYFWTDNINKIFNIQKFDLIDSKTINKYKQICKEQLNQ